VSTGNGKGHMAGEQGTGLSRAGHGIHPPTFHTKMQCAVVCDACVYFVCVCVCVCVCMCVRARAQIITEC